METVTTLDDKVRAFKVLLDKKDELAEQTKANNEELKNLEQEIAQQMVDEEKPDTTVDGFKYSLQEKTRYSKISEEKLVEKGLVFFDVLREQGFGHLITERVDPRTLDSAMNNLAAENDGELPEEMAEVLSVYSELKVSKRKANTKALNRARHALGKIGGLYAVEEKIRMEHLEGMYQKTGVQICVGQGKQIFRFRHYQPRFLFFCCLYRFLWFFYRLCS